MEDPVVHLERNLYGHPLAGLLWESQLEGALLDLSTDLECMFVHRKLFFLSVYVDDMENG